MTIAIYALGASYALWLFFLAVMRLKQSRDAGTLGPWAYRFGVPILLTGYVLDFAVNVVVLTPAFLELPHETTVTARLKRHKYANNWRGAISRWVATNLLDPFDPSGRHI